MSFLPSPLLPLDRDPFVISFHPFSTRHSKQTTNITALSSCRRKLTCSGLKNKNKEQTPRKRTNTPVHTPGVHLAATKYQCLTILPSSQKPHLVVICFRRHLRRPASVRRGLQPPAEREVAPGSPDEELRADQVELLVQDSVVGFRGSLQECKRNQFIFVCGVTVLLHTLFAWVLRTGCDLQILSLL